MDYPDLENLPEDLKQIIAGKRGANVYKMLMHCRRWRLASRRWRTR